MYTFLNVFFSRVNPTVVQEKTEYNLLDPLKEEMQQPSSDEDYFGNVNDFAMTSQDSEGTFKCGECGKLCANRKTLIKHKYTHSDDKDFHCTYCGKGFVRKGHLKTHIEGSHENKRKYRCVICHKRFNLKGSAKRHYYSVHLKSKEAQSKI
jgi:uncharacterized Zn-finger protein